MKTNLSLQRTLPVEAGGSARAQNIELWRPAGSLAGEADAAWRDTLDDPEETAGFARLVRRAVLSLEPRRVLDVGCGTGLPTLEAARAGAPRVLGIDPVPRNVFLARTNIRRAQLDARVTAHPASWEDVLSGSFHTGAVDLLVANPPYVPAGVGSAVGGGPTGTRLIDAILDGLPAQVRGVALLFSSLSNPLHVLSRLCEQGFQVSELCGRSVAFGRYTSQPSTLSALKRLRIRKLAWFSDAPQLVPSSLARPRARFDEAPHEYLTLGVVGVRTQLAGCTPSVPWDELPALLSSYQRTGEAALAAFPWLGSL